MDRVFSFLLWPKREVRGPWKHGRKKQGSITCPTDWANEANKMFIIWFCWLFRFWKGNRELEVRTATYGPGIDQSQHAKSVSHIIILFTFHNGFTYKRFDVQEWKDFSGEFWMRERLVYFYRCRYQESGIRYVFGWGRSQPKRWNTSPKPNGNNSNKGSATGKFWFGYFAINRTTVHRIWFFVSPCAF